MTKRVCLTIALLLGTWLGGKSAWPADVAQQGTTSAKAERVIQQLKTSNGVEFGVWGTLPAKPAPTLIVLANTIEGTLGDAYFRQAGNALGAQGYLVVSLDLPCHGTQWEEGEPIEIAGWCHRCEQGKDFVSENNRRLESILDHLIASGHTAKDQIAICGTSRGGFLALHFAAHDPRIKCVAAYAPVTDLSALREFQGTKALGLMPALSLEKQARNLADRAVWVIIGDRDDRVGTDRAISLARSITQAALDRGKSSKVDLHVVAEPRGHTSPAGSAEQSATWIQQQFALPAQASSLAK